MKNSKPVRAATFSLRTCLVFSLILGAMQAWAQQPAPAAAKPAANSAARLETYSVKPGDSLSAIAKRFGLDLRELAEWNGLTDPSRIRVGQRLRLAPEWPANRLPAQELAAQELPAQKRPAQTLPARPEAAKAPTPGTASTPITPTEVRDQSAKGAGEIEQLRATTSSLIVLLLQQGVISREKAEELMQQAQLGPLPPGVATRATPPVASAGEMAGADASALARASPTPGAAPTREAPPAAPATQTAQAEPGVVRVPYVPEIVKNEIRDQVKEEVIAQAKAERWAEPNALPEWLDRISFYGDLRLRYQYDSYGTGNVPAAIYNGITGSDQANTTQNESLFRYRARLGLRAKVTEQVGADFRITTGNFTNPVSTNQSLGDYFNRSFIELDRAYLSWNPNERWTLLGGRTPNPFFHTDLVWDEDLNFDGFSASFKPKFKPDWRGFLTGGFYVVQLGDATPVTPDPKSKYLFGVQAGTDFDLGRQAKVKLGLAYYDYQNIQGIPNPAPGSQINDWTVPLFTQKGNMLFNINTVSNPGNPLYALAAEFGVLDFNASAELAYFDPVVVRVYGDFATNLAFDADEIQSRTGVSVSRDVNAYKLGLTVGQAALSGWGDWQAFFSYRYIEGDAVLDAFNDSDFHLGGTDAKGYEVGGSFALHRNLWLRARWISADQINGPPLAIDVFQFDLNARF